MDMWLLVSVFLVLTCAILIYRLFADQNANVFRSDAAFFSELNHALSSTNDLHELLIQTLNVIVRKTAAKDASFVIYTEDEQAEQVGLGKYSKVSYRDARLFEELLDTNIFEPVIKGSLKGDKEHLRRMMVSHRIEVIFPLVRQGSVVGLLLLGEHSLTGYSIRDIRKIQSLHDELVIAVQNALSVEQIKELNSHLEQRVDAATKELRRSNAQLQKLDEAKDEFISMASHQLRTPLTSIKGYISMLMEGDVGKVTPEQKHVLNEAFVSSERMVRLISDFLNVSRLQTGKFVIDKHPVDLARLVQREIDGLDANATARGMKFVYKAPKNIPELQLDENKIQQVVMNFSDNAIYYSKENSKIAVSLKKAGDWIEFSVKDAGIGVPKDEQAHLFTKFFRATNAKRARPDGTGVGLFLAKKVIDDHDGQLIFESKEGKGSTFGFRLPLPKGK